MALSTLRSDLESGPFPDQDGWRWLYGGFQRVAPPGHALRRILCAYYWPSSVERWRSGLVFRLLGVHVFGALIPTGGIAIRRATGTRMAPYVLAGTSRRSARDFYYRTCVFESLHIPFLLSLVLLALHRLSIGRTDLAIENTIVNLVVNVYPVLHHRRTRGRIVHLLSRRR